MYKIHFSVIRRLQEHQEFFPAFYEVMNKLLEILGKFLPTNKYFFKYSTSIVVIILSNFQYCLAKY